MKGIFFTILSIAMLSNCPAFAETPATKPVPTSGVVAATIALADSQIADPGLAAYRGWLKYLEFRIAFDTAKFGADSDLARADVADLAKWTAKIKADPDAIRKIRGVQEWAYESLADGSGQPFILVVPTDYDPARPTPLAVQPHGYSNDQRSSLAWMQPHAGGFEIAVLGRARGGQFLCLSEADVLDAMKYVRKYWNIDADRMTIASSSMGGFCSFWLGARHPDLWAGVNPGCAYPWQAPIENLQTIPVYSLHSIDDPIVPVVFSHAVVTRLSDLGTKIVYEETNGYGHAVWNFHEGFARSGEWLARQVRARDRDVYWIDFSAMDATCARAWWAEVAEWGPLPKLARFSLSAGSDNMLYARIENVARLKIYLSDSPFDRAVDLRVSVNGGIAFAIKAPLPESVELACDSQSWQVAASVSRPFRLHTPYGARMVYDGSPMLIVYGTQGTAEENAAILAAAKAASTSPNPAWQTGLVDPAADGVSHLCNLYGNLKIKADRDVTADDIARCNLVVIGTAAQNSVVAKMVSGMPVRIEGGKIVCDDGESYAFSGRAMGLVHFNPLSPQRLMLWLASDDVRFYRPGAVLPYEMNAHGYGADFLVMDAVEPVVVAARAFDSEWNWAASDAKSPILGADASTSDGWARVLAESIRESVGADFGISASADPDTNYFFDRHPSPRAADGETKLSDMALLYANYRIFTIAATGAQLADLAGKIEASDVKRLAFSPNFDAAKLDPARTYTVATIDEGVWSAKGLGFFFQPTSKWTGVEASDAIAKFGAK